MVAWDRKRMNTNEIVVLITLTFNTVQDCIVLTALY